MALKRNMSTIDRIIRTAMGLALLYYGPISDALVSDLLSGLLMGFVGAFTLFSAITGHCSIYNFAGICTYKETSTETVEK